MIPGGTHGPTKNCRFSTRGTHVFLKLRQNHPSGSHGPADRESVPDPKKKSRKPKGGNDDGPAPGTPTPGSVPKARTASQEAKSAPMLQHAAALRHVCLICWVQSACFSPVGLS